MSKQFTQFCLAGKIVNNEQQVKAIVNKITPETEYLRQQCWAVSRLLRKAKANGGAK